MIEIDDRAGVRVPAPRGHRASRDYARTFSAGIRIYPNYVRDGRFLCE